MVATKRKIDLRNVKESGSFRPRRVEEGEYVGKITNVEDHTSNKGGEGWVFTFILDDNARNSYPIYVQSDDKSAWKVRKLMIAAGLKAPKSLIMFDPNKLVNRKIGVYMEDDEYEGREKSNVADFIPVDEVTNHDEIPDDQEIAEEDLEDEEEIDEEPEPAPRRTKRRAAPEPEPEDDDEEELDDEPEPEPTPPPRRKRRPAPAPEPEPEDDEDEDEEPAPPPRRTRPAAKKAAARKATPPPVDEDDDDLDLDDL